MDGGRGVPFGADRGAVGRTYGRGVPLKVLKDAVERITFPAVEPRRRHHD